MHPAVAAKIWRVIIGVCGVNTDINPCKGGGKRNGQLCPAGILGRLVVMDLIGLVIIRTAENGQPVESSFMEHVGGKRDI